MTEEQIVSRNRHIKFYFECLGFKVYIRGSIHDPAIIFGGNKVMALKIVNYKILFLRSRFTDEVMFEVKTISKVKPRPDDFDMDQFKDWIENANHAKVYSIGIRDFPKMKYCRMLKKDSQNSEDRFASFSATDYTIFLSFERAVQRMDEIDVDFRLQVITE